MRYIIANNEDVDLLEIVTEDDRVTEVVALVPHLDDSDPTTAEELQEELSVYLHEGSQNSTIEDALVAYVGGLHSIRKVSD